MGADVEYLKRAFHTNRKFIRVFSVFLILNMLYTSIVRFVYIGYFSIYYSAVTFGLILPVTVGAVILGNVEVYEGWLHVAREVFLAANSVLFAFILQLRSLVCYFGLEAQCAKNQRPLVEGLYAYTLTGPILTLFIYTTSLYYEGAFMLALYAFVIITDIYLNPDTTHLLTSLLVGGFYVITIYISKRFRQADQVQALLDRQKELEESSHAFVSYMLHELRNPLNNATLILSTDDATEADRARTIEELEGAKVIMDDALTYSSLSGGVLSTAEYEDRVVNVCRQVHAMFVKSTSAQGIILQFQHETVHQVLVPAAAQFKQILVILLRYSISRSKRGDVVDLAFEFDERLKVHLIDEGRREWALAGTSNLSIQYHTSDASRGQELSLNLALKLLESMGCDVMISNTVLAGFDITFTCAAREDTTIAASPEAEIKTSRRNSSTETLHILITDDNVFTCRFLAKLLEKLDHTSEIAHDGIECIEKMGEQHFDLVLLDSMMPKLDGPGVLKHVKEHHLAIPIICVTANSEKSDIAQLDELGAKMVLSKPVSIATLKGAIKTVFSPC